MTSRSRVRTVGLPFAPDSISATVAGLIPASAANSRWLRSAAWRRARRRGPRSSGLRTFGGGSAFWAMATSLDAGGAADQEALRGCGYAPCVDSRGGPVWRWREYEVAALWGS